jgi:hypothetical protein
VEWVPPSDPMYQEWLRGRDELYGRLAEADLVAALEPFFRQIDRTELGNGRVLLVFERVAIKDGVIKVNGGTLAEAQAK